MAVPRWGVQLLAFQNEGPRSIPCQSIYLWWIKWQCDRPFPEYFGFRLFVSPHQRRTFVSFLAERQMDEAWEPSKQQCSFYVYGYVHRWSVLIVVQRDATKSGLFIILQVHCTCFGCQLHPSAGVHKSVTTASGTGHNFCAATSLQRGQAQEYTKL